MSARVKRNWEMLKTLKSASSQRRRKILDAGSDDLLLAICELVDNVLNGTVKLSRIQRQKLLKYKSVLRALADRKVPKTLKRTIVQKGGFLPLILGPALAVVASLVGEVIGKAISK